LTKTAERRKIGEGNRRHIRPKTRGAFAREKNVAKTIEEINEKIRTGKAVVVTAEEMVGIVKKKGETKAAREIDVVTTGTFGPMCSSSIYLNFGHSSPKIKIGGGTCTLNGVPAYTGLAAVDVILGATAVPASDPCNRNFPGEFRYGGGHVIEDLVAGKEVRLDTSAYGTDCYPRKELSTLFTLAQINEAVLFNPRNCYQNYNVAVNTTRKTIYTYMGVLKPLLHNANYCSAGTLSPLLRDPEYRTLGIGTRIFLGGGTGYIVWQGTQHNPSVPRTPEGVPKRPAGTLAVIGDAKQMSCDYLRGASLTGYGVSLCVGIGIPIPIVDEKAALQCGLPEEKLLAPVVDYGKEYPSGGTRVLAEVSYAQLRSGTIRLCGKNVPTGSLSSLPIARKIANALADSLRKGTFLLTTPVAPIPGPQSGLSPKALAINPPQGDTP